MNTKKKQKKFDAIQMVRDIRAQMREERLANPHAFFARVKALGDQEREKRLKQLG